MYHNFILFLYIDKALSASMCLLRSATTGAPLLIRLPLVVAIVELTAAASNKLSRCWYALRSDFSLLKAGVL